MSHTVTVTRTTTSTTASAIIINTGFLRSVPGILKFFETIIGAICLGLIAYYAPRRVTGAYADPQGFIGDREETLFFLVTFAFLVTTFLLLVSSVGSLITTSILPKTLFELLYHLVAFIFYLSASLALIIVVSRRNERAYYKEYGYEGKMAAAVLGLVNSVLYLLSTVFSFRSFRVG